MRVGREAWPSPWPSPSSSAAAVAQGVPVLLPCPSGSAPGVPEEAQRGGQGGLVPLVRGLVSGRKGGSCWFSFLFLSSMGLEIIKN